MTQRWVARGRIPGPRVVVCVGIHRDEAGHVAPALGPALPLWVTQGEVVLLEAFPGAPARRCLGPEGQDPNRCFLPRMLERTGHPYFDRLRALAREVEQADYVVDVHRYSWPNGGVVAIPHGQGALRWALRAGFERIVRGFSVAVPGTLGAWAAQAGAEVLGLECGPKGDAPSTDRAAAWAILTALSAVGVAAAPPPPPECARWQPAPRVWTFERPMRTPRGAQRERLPALFERVGHLQPVGSGVADALGIVEGEGLFLPNPSFAPPAYVCRPV